MIGKGKRSPEVIEAMKRNGAVYLCAIGGAGALAAQCIESAEVIAFEDLGCESVKRLVLKDFPLIVAIDSTGDSIVNKAFGRYPKTGYLLERKSFDVPFDYESLCPGYGERMTPR